MKLIQIISLFLVVIAVLNIALFALRKTDIIFFWFVIMLCGISAYLIKRTKR